MNETELLEWFLENLANKLLEAPVVMVMDVWLDLIKTPIKVEFKVFGHGEEIGVQFKIAEWSKKGYRFETPEGFIIPNGLGGCRNAPWFVRQTLESYADFLKHLVNEMDKTLVEMKGNKL